MSAIQNNYRSNPSFRKEEILKVLPSFFAEEYPLFVKLFEYYYEYMDTNSATSRLDDLLKNRDITEIASDLLEFLQRELLLGEQTFNNVSQRDILKLNSILLNSKGSEFSIKQFFRYFYGFDPDIVHTKDNVFIVGQSRIGPESRKFITNDKLYQTFAVLIKTPLSLSQWQATYKKFVHPAGLYLGAEVLIEDTAMANFTAPESEEFVVTGPTVSDTATVTILGQEELTSLVDI